LQLGGNDPLKLGQAVELCEQYKGGNFCEINLNCGCPSNRAKKAGFGAELMMEPELVRQIVYEMKRRSHKTEITVKCRIGTNKRDKWEHLVEFINACKAGGVNRVIVHSRLCILNGLSPAQNRSIPPLIYDVAHHLVHTYPDMTFVLNGGIKSFEEVDMHMARGKWADEPLTCTPWSPPSSFSQHTAEGTDTDINQHGLPEDGESLCLAGSDGCCDSEFLDPGSAAPEFVSDSHESQSDSHRQYKPLWAARPVHGVMIGREAYNNPWMLADADRYFYGVSNPGLSRREVLEAYLQYASEAQDRGEFKSTAPVLCRPLHNFFYGSDTNRLFKRKFDDVIKRKGRGPVDRHCRSEVRIDDLVWEAIEGTISDSFLDERMGEDGKMHCSI
jgi:tRNA-dihydrouridine synthase